jgi:hypothetical protein
MRELSIVFEKSPITAGSAASRLLADGGEAMMPRVSRVFQSDITQANYKPQFGEYYFRGEGL